LEDFYEDNIKGKLKLKTIGKLNPHFNLSKVKSYTIKYGLKMLNDPIFLKSFKNK
jgi:hypothetical protein